MQQQQQQQQQYQQQMQRQQQSQLNSSRVSQERRSTEQQPATDYRSGSSTQGRTSRDRSGSDASSLQGTQNGYSPITSPDNKRDKRFSQRKSRGEDDAIEEKQGKKRSGVFSGLFSRSKDKKERKSGSFGHQTGGSGDGESLLTGRSSEDSTTRRSLNSFSPGQSMGMGRAVQEKDRAVQEAYQRQFLQDPRREHGERSARPGSLIGTPATVPMLNVLRVFAGNNLDTDATFKTVLLNESTTSHDLIRQAMQRFRLGAGHSISDYVLTVKLVEGDERVLHSTEKPLKVFDLLTESMAESSRDIPVATMPSVKRSSVGSISSISSNLSMHPAIARLGNDFSDDHEVKFYLNRKEEIGPDSTQDRSFASSLNPNYGDASLIDPSGHNSSLLGVANESIDNRSSIGSAETQDTIQTNNLSRFALRLLIFPSDLPEGTVFDPQTNALIPKQVLAERGSAGTIPGEGVEQQYREKILALPRNTTVAEVIEQGLDRFGIAEGVVEGGDNVEERSGRRRSKAKIRYGLCLDINNVERSLLPTSKVVEAYPFPPTYYAGPNSRRGMEGRRRSQDSAMLLSMAEEIRPADPVFILRQVHTHKSKTIRALSPTEEVLTQRQDQRRQAELETVAPAPSAKALEEARIAATTDEENGNANHLGAGAGAVVGAGAIVGAGAAAAVGVGIIAAAAAAGVGAGAAAAAVFSTATPTSPTLAPAVTTPPTPTVTQGMTQQEIITAQRAAARERRAAVLGDTQQQQQQSPPSQVQEQQSSVMNQTPSLQSLGSMADGDFGLEHLFAVVDAASRRRPVLTTRGKKGSSVVPQQQTAFQNSGTPLYDFKPQCAGLFPPPAPIIADKRVKDIYLPIGKHLNSLEDSLDQLLSDAMRTF